MTKIVKGKDFELKEVWVSLGKTINLGNYESARIDKGIKLTNHKKCNNEEEFNVLAEELFNVASDLVAEAVDKDT